MFEDNLHVSNTEYFKKKVEIEATLAPLLLEYSKKLEGLVKRRYIENYFVQSRDISICHFQKRRANFLPLLCTLPTGKPDGGHAFGQ